MTFTSTINETLQPDCWCGCHISAVGAPVSGHVGISLVLATAAAFALRRKRKLFAHTRADVHRDGAATPSRLSSPQALACASDHAAPALARTS